MKIQSVASNYKKILGNKNIGKCCISDLIYQQNILSDTTVQWGKDSLTSAKWCSNDHQEDYSFIDSKIEQDNSFEYCVELSNTKYKDHLEMKIIEKDIFEEDIYSKKNMNKSFAEFLTTVQGEGVSDKVKQDQVMLLKSFMSFMLETKETPEDKIYVRGQGMMALFLLCFCSIKRAFYIMKEIYLFFYADILHTDQIKKEINYCSIVKHIVFYYLENFQKKKDPTAQFIEKIVAFTRKYLYYQYNYFFLNQLNLSSAFTVLTQLFTERSHEVITKALASIIHLNIKTITETDLEKVNLKDIIYNKVQAENIQLCLVQEWNKLKKEAMNKIMEEHYRILELEQYKKYECGADELTRAVKICIKKQKDNYKLMENHYQKEIKDLQNALKLAMNELTLNAQKIHNMEVEKNNILVKFSALKRKYEVNEIEYEDIQSKLQLLNERTSKRQTHYNKEYEAQILELQQKVKNQKLDYKEIDMLYMNLQQTTKQQLEEKDNIIKRLRQGINLLQRQRNEVNLQDKTNESLQELYELCKNINQKSQIEQQKEQDSLNNNNNHDDQIKIDPKLFHSYIQPTTTTTNIKANNLFPKLFNQNNTLFLKQIQSSETTSSIQESIKQNEQQNNSSNEIEDEITFYAFSGNLNQNKSQSNSIQQSSNIQHQQNTFERQNEQSTNNQLSQSVLSMYKSCSNDNDNDDINKLQDAINQMSNSPTESFKQNEQSSENNVDQIQFVSYLDHSYIQQSNDNNSSDQSQQQQQLSNNQVQPNQILSPIQKIPRNIEQSNNNITKSAQLFNQFSTPPIIQGQSKQMSFSEDTFQSKNNNINDIESININKSSINVKNQDVNNIFNNFQPISNKYLMNQNHRTQSQLDMVKCPQINDQGFNKNESQSNHQKQNSINLQKLNQGY